MGVHVVPSHDLGLVVESPVFCGVAVILLCLFGVSIHYERVNRAMQLRGNKYLANGAVGALRGGGVMHVRPKSKATPPPTGGGGAAGSNGNAAATGPPAGEQAPAMAGGPAHLPGAAAAVGASPKHGGTTPSGTGSAGRRERERERLVAREQAAEQARVRDFPYYCRRVGLAASICCTLWAIDLHGALGYYPYLLGNILSSGATTLYFVACSFWIWYHSAAVFKHLQKPAPVWFRRALTGFPIAFGIWALSCNIGLEITDHYGFTVAYFGGMALEVLCFIVLCLVTYTQLRSQLRTFMAAVERARVKRLAVAQQQAAAAMAAAVQHHHHHQQHQPQSASSPSTHTSESRFALSVAAPSSSRSTPPFHSSNTSAMAAAAAVAGPLLPSPTAAVAAQQAALAAAQAAASAASNANSQLHLHKALHVMWIFVLIVVPGGSVFALILLYLVIAAITGPRINEPGVQPPTSLTDATSLIGLDALGWVLVALLCWYSFAPRPKSHVMPLGGAAVGASPTNQAAVGSNKQSGSGNGLMRALAVGGGGGGANNNKATSPLAGASQSTQGRRPPRHNSLGSSTGVGPAALIMRHLADAAAASAAATAPALQAAAMRPHSGKRIPGAAQPSSPSPVETVATVAAAASMDLTAAAAAFNGGGSGGDSGGGEAMQRVNSMSGTMLAAPTIIASTATTVNTTTNTTTSSGATRTSTLTAMPTTIGSSPRSPPRGSVDNAAAEAEAVFGRAGATTTPPAVTTPTAAPPTMLVITVDAKHITPAPLPEPAPAAAAVVVTSAPLPSQSAAAPAAASTAATRLGGISTTPQVILQRLPTALASHIVTLENGDDAELRAGDTPFAQRMTGGVIAPTPGPSALTSASPLERESAAAAASASSEYGYGYGGGAAYVGGAGYSGYGYGSSGTGSRAAPSLFATLASPSNSRRRSGGGW